MAKAWERQLGARVELNVEKQWARLTFENGSVDGAAIAKTAADTGYTITGMTIETEGVAREARCSDCDELRWFLDVGGSRAIELRGALPARIGERWRLEGRMRGWLTDHAFIEVRSVTALR